MKFSVFGLGFVGLTALNCLAREGAYGIGIDIDKKRIEDLKNGKIPFVEPNLERLVKKNLKKEYIRFSTDSSECKEANIHFICVGTPPEKHDSMIDWLEKPEKANLDYVFKVVRNLGSILDSYEKNIIVIKSTVPPGTNKEAEEQAKELSLYETIVVSNPEFLREGNAVNDFKKEKIVIGTDSKEAFEILKELYRPIVRKTTPIIQMRRESAELLKYSSNGMLLTRISFMNEIAKLAERVGADIEEIKYGLSLDRRIGKFYLNPGIGCGGSCLPKDIDELINTAEESKLRSKILIEVRRRNIDQRDSQIQMLLEYYNETYATKFLEDKTFAVWGLAFKGGKLKNKTDDIRFSPGVYVVQQLVKYGAKVNAHDPFAIENTKKVLGEENITYTKDMYQALENADGLLICNNWETFKNAELDIIKLKLKFPLIVDGVNIFEYKKMQIRDFDYLSIGRPPIYNELDFKI